MVLYKKRIQCSCIDFNYLLLSVSLVLSFPVFAQKADTSKAKGKDLPSYAQDLSVVLRVPAIQSGTDKNSAQLLKRLPGVIVTGHYSMPHSLSTLNVYGMGARYNQVLLNGTVFHSSDPVSKMYPLDMLPTEAIEQVSVQKITHSSIPADFAGGTIAIKTNDLPAHNFFYVLAGSGFSAKTNGNNFLGDKRGSLEFLSFPGSTRSLPAAFPTSRSYSYLNEMNPQEQVYFSRQLKNNLQPRNFGQSIPDDRVMLGFGRMINLTKNDKVGISVYLNHQRSERIDESNIQVSPDLTNNLDPFSDRTKQLIRSQADDINYRYAASLSAVVNATVLFRTNKISLKTFLVSQFNNTYTERSYVVKPDEDTLAHSGVLYKPEYRKMLNIQLSGEHALGKSQNFIIDWQAAYTHYHQQNPDERHFLARPDAVNGNTFQLAQASAASLSSPDAMFTNSGRLWRNYTDHNFTGAFNIGVPFTIADRAQHLSGGIYVETRNREFYSDLLLVQGSGYYAPGDLLDAGRYYPGGLSIQNYFIHFNPRLMNGVVQSNNWGNYTASSNIGASYVNLESYLTKQVSLNGGIRVESISQLVSNTEYRYFSGFRNPRITPLDQNSHVNKFNILPSVQANYQPLEAVRVHAAWFKTVNRAQLQELTATQYYDASTFMVRKGNPILANSTIDNFDVGIGWNAGVGSNISVSGLYKKIDQPIEYILSSYANSRGNLLLTPHNTPPAEIYGLQASFRINFNFLATWLSPVSLFANGNWLQSTVKAGPVKSGLTPHVAEHSLSGSPMYTVNGGFTIQHDKFPGLTVLYSRTGDYIFAVGSGAVYTLESGGTVLAVPDYRVKGRDQLDIQLSQKLFKARLQLIAGVHNLFNDPYIEYQDLNGNKKMDAPLTIHKGNGTAGFYESGIDNTVLKITQQQTYYITISYLFR
jgi:hypothetical protein